MSGTKKRNKIKLVLYTAEGLVIGVVKRLPNDTIVGRHHKRKRIAYATPFDTLDPETQKDLTAAFLTPASLASAQRRRGGPEGFEQMRFNKPRIPG